MSFRRNSVVYVLLILAGVVIGSWQTVEHLRAREAARSALLRRALDISNTLGGIIRSQAVFGMVFQTRLEVALRELTKSGDLKSVALLYASGEVAASAGESVQPEARALGKQGVEWGQDEFTVVNPVDLGSSAEDGGKPQTSIVIPQGQTMEQYRPPRPPREERPREDKPKDENGAPAKPSEARPRERRPPPTFGRPYWMDEKRYQDLVNKQGVHYFVVSLSTEDYRATVWADFRTRLLVAGVALVAVSGLALAWRNSDRFSSLQLDLLRADEMNRHLQEMNLAAAGLAHETRNPLNIIRGFAQMISRREDAPGDIRETSWRIADEVDRITERLNGFIAYSRPPEAKPAPTDVKAVVMDVARTLETDREDKDIQFEFDGPELVVEADESLLRQVVFNLLLNAIQALQRGGKVCVSLSKDANGAASLEVRDNGPGVPESAREDIFRPYYTASEQGTGLGLAVVRQAVLAHRWNVDYLPANEGGAVFRVTGLQVV